MDKVNVVIIDGAVRSESMTRRLAYLVAGAFDERAEVTVFDQKLLELPMYDDRQELRSNSAVSKLLSSVAEADAIVLSSPEYHGSMSGALKNALDWCTLVEGELRGKVVGLIGGGGALANSGATLQMMMAVRAMHGWLMPDAVLSVPSIWDAFDEQGCLRDAGLRKRLKLFAGRLTAYAELFRREQGIFREVA